MREEPGPGKGQPMGMVYVFPAMYSVEGVGRQTSLKGEPKLEGPVAAGSDRFKAALTRARSPEWTQVRHLSRRWKPDMFSVIRP